MDELLPMIIGVAAWLGWTALFRNDPAWGSAKLYWSVVIVIALLTSFGMASGRGF